MGDQGTAGKAVATTRRRYDGRFRVRREVLDRFLDHLAATADLERSSAEAGVPMTTLYTLRRRNPAFANEWRMALLTGYDRLEGALIRKALGLAEDAPVVDLGPGSVCERGEIDVGLAMLLLERHRATADPATKAARATAFRASRDGAEAALLARLRTYARRTAGAGQGEGGDGTA